MLLSSDDSTPASDSTSYERAQREAEALYKQEAETEINATRSRTVTRLVRSVIGILIGCALLGILWKFGLLSRGFDKRRVTFASFTSTSRGVGFGPKTIYATAGQTISVQYSAQVTRGYFRIWIRQAGLATLGPVEASTGNLRSGAGNFQFVVPRNGFIKL